MKESGIARTFNQLFFIISSLLTFFHFLLYLSKVITKDNQFLNRKETFP